MSSTQGIRRVRPHVRLSKPSTVVLGVILVVAVLIGPSVAIFFSVVASLFVLVACIGLHEAGHAAAAHALGFDVVEVRLGLFDSATAYEADERTAHDRVLCALAGPAASLSLAIVFGVAAWVAGPDPVSFPAQLAFLNLVVALANLVPLKGTDGWEIVAGLRGEAD